MFYSVDRGCHDLPVSFFSSDPRWLVYVLALSASFKTQGFLWNHHVDYCPEAVCPLGSRIL